MEASIGYEKELQNYIDNEKAAIKLANYVGELLFDKGIELVLFRNHLLDTTNSEIINLHDYAEKVVGKKIFIKTTAAIAEVRRTSRVVQWLRERFHPTPCGTLRTSTRANAASWGRCHPMARGPPAISAE